MQTAHTTFSFLGGLWDSSVQAGGQRRHKVYAWTECGHLLWNALVLIFQKNKPDFLEQYALGKSGLFYRGKAEHGRKGEARSPRLRRSDAEQKIGYMETAVPLQLWGQLGFGFYSHCPPEEIQSDAAKQAF